MNQSNTPRTDGASQVAINIPSEDWYEAFDHMRNECRQLETELSAAQQSNGEAIKTIQRYIAELKAANERADDWKRMAEELAESFSKSWVTSTPETAKTLAKFDQMKGKL